MSSVSATAYEKAIEVYTNLVSDSIVRDNSGWKHATFLSGTYTGAAYVGGNQCSNCTTVVNAQTLNLISTLTNCSSSASPAVCAAAPSGNVTVAAAATTKVVNTTAVTANSQILLTFDSSLGTKLGVTCNTTYVNAYVTARTAGTSFTITVASAPTTNPACFSYTILN